MFKQNKFKLIITSLIILLPMLYGLAMWEQLPDTLPRLTATAAAHLPCSAFR